MLFQIFLTFFKIGAFTFGGGFAMIPIIQREVVENKHWVTEEEFLDTLALSQGSPGPIAVNASIYIGHTIKGYQGALAATLGTVMPSFLIILVIARFFYQFRDNPILDKIFLGIRPTIVALIVSAVYGLLKKSNFGYKRLTVAIVTAALIVFLDISPIYLILAGGIGSIIINKWIIKDEFKNIEDDEQ